MSYAELLESNPEICSGQLVFKGTRVLVRTILLSIADGDTDERLLAAFPSLKPEHIRAAIEFAAARAAEEMPLPPLPKWAKFAEDEDDVVSPATRK